MDVQLTADVQAKLDQLSGVTGRAPNDLVRDALAGYFEELAQVRGLLDGRYDELKSGSVTLLGANEIATHFREKSAARRS